MQLDVMTPGNVAGHSVLRADLAIGGRQLVVISGIACPGWKVDDDDEAQRQECRVLLREPADDLETATVHVGLASIGNDDTAWVFATDMARVEVDPTTEELVLVVNLALMGDVSTLNRFSYQVVLTTVKVVAEISGTISWPKVFFAPSAPGPSGVSGVFTIQANVRHSTGLEPVTPGQVVDVTVDDGGDCHARYRITEPPKNKDLLVTVAQRGLAAPGVDNIEFGPTSPGGDETRLTNAHPVDSDVNFVAVAFEDPH
ncbi:hypothetical protein [Mycolicibacterium sp.]|uniref:hypothetical protein n=1 Tax=Mycolicibacterium sp. TaxID=2320850 RepID=UPI0037CB4F55